jgi:hypothetical protein
MTHSRHRPEFLGAVAAQFDLYQSDLPYGYDAFS